MIFKIPPDGRWQLVWLMIKASVCVCAFTWSEWMKSEENVSWGNMEINVVLHFLATVLMAKLS